LVIRFTRFLALPEHETARRFATPGGSIVTFIIDCHIAMAFPPPCRSSVTTPVRRTLPLRFSIPRRWK